MVTADAGPPEALNVVLLGGTGFVGSAVLRVLAEEPAVRVRALVRDPARFAPPRPVEIVEGDARNAPTDLFPPEPHVVFHFAVKQVDADGAGFASNVEGVADLMEKLPNSTRGLLYGSSASVYGQGPQTDETEDAPLRPETPLARSRAAAERVILEGARARGMGAYCLRPRFILGPGDRHTLPGLIRMVRRGVQPGSGRQRLAVIGVDDYARVLVRLGRRLSVEPEQAPLNVAYARSVSLDEIVASIRRRFSLRQPRVRVPVSLASTRLLRKLPFRSLGGLATRLELIGLSHTLDVGRLQARVGGDLLAREPLEVLDEALHGWE